ncbi:guanyl-specific ribonuclease C2 [Mycena vitilis]|nr:guanyl-specific ribonuclease C2 [Mycena vitilis]
MFFARSLLTAILVAPLALAAPTLGPKGLVTCGRNRYETYEVNSAVRTGYGYLKKGKTISNYPHVLNGIKSLLAAECKDVTAYEFPILPDAIFNGSTGPGPDRVILNGSGDYCGVLTHTGASGNTFVSCTVSELHGILKSP